MVETIASLKNLDAKTQTCQPVLIKAPSFIPSVHFALLSILLLPKPILKDLSSHKPVWWRSAIITQNPSLSFSLPVCLSLSLHPFSIVSDRLFITAPKTSHYRLYYSGRPLSWCTGAPLSLQLNQGAKLLTCIAQEQIELSQLCYRSHFSVEVTRWGLPKLISREKQGSGWN